MTLVRLLGKKYANKPRKKKNKENKTKKNKIIEKKGKSKNLFTV